MKKRIFINIGEKESRIAFLEDGDLVELFVEQNDNRNKVGNVYKGVVEGVIPGIQAAFVDIGLEKNAFLHFNDVNVEPLIAEALQEQQLARKRARRRVTNGPAPDQGFYIRVEDILKPGKELIVQMTKEAIGTKGARISANLTLPGKFLVLLPGLEGQGGVSKKIEDNNERKRLKKILSQIDIPNASFIIRTAGVGKTTREIYADVDALLDTWEGIQAKARNQKKPGCIHQDHDLVRRLVRDHLPEDVHEVTVDDVEVGEQLKALLIEYNSPQLAERVKVRTGAGNLFEKFNIEHQINVALRRTVPLKCGGSLVFDETEALTAVDVNTGSFIGKKDQEKTILQANLEAAETIARQLRLRDIGGLIVIDFIDMATRDSQRKVLTSLRDAMLRGGDKFSLGRFSEFGCVEMTRKRVRTSLRKTLTKECPYCGGMGRIRIESQVWRDVKYALLGLFPKYQGGTYEVIVHPQMADYISDEFTPLLGRWEKEYGVRVDVRVLKSFHFETYKISRNGRVLAESAMNKVEEFHDVDYIEPKLLPDDDGDDDGEPDAEPVFHSEGSRRREADDRSDERGGREGRRRASQRAEAPAPAPAEVDEDDDVFAAPEAEVAPEPARHAAPARTAVAAAPSRVSPAIEADGAEERDDEDADDEDSSDRPRRRRRRRRRRGGEAGETDAPASAAPAPANADDDLDDVPAANDAPEQASYEAASEPLTARRGRNRRRQRGEAPAASDEVEAEPEVKKLTAPAPAYAQPAVRPPATEHTTARKPELADLEPGLYGIQGDPVRQRRRSKRRKFDPNQEKDSHYGWTPMGPSPTGNGTPKRGRPGQVFYDPSKVLGAEPSLFVRALHAPVIEEASGEAPASQAPAQAAASRDQRRRQRPGKAEATQAAPEPELAAPEAKPVSAESPVAQSPATPPASTSRRKGKAREAVQAAPQLAPAPEAEAAEAPAPKPARPSRRKPAAETAAESAQPKVKPAPAEEPAAASGEAPKRSRPSRRR